MKILSICRVSGCAGYSHRDSHRDSLLVQLAAPRKPGKPSQGAVVVPLAELLGDGGHQARALAAAVLGEQEFALRTWAGTAGHECCDSPMRHFENGWGTSCGLTFLLGAIMEVYFSSRSWMRGCFWNSEPSTAMVVVGLSMRSSREARPATEPERIGLLVAVTRGRGRGQGGWEGDRTDCDEQGGPVRSDLAHPLNDEDVVRVEVEVEVIEDLFGVTMQAVNGVPSHVHTQKYW